MIIFSYHDLAHDPPFTRMNLVCCRNLLIYVQSNMQQKIIRNLHFALNHQGTLFLGEVETLGSLETEFLTINQKWRLYRKRRDFRLPLLSKPNSLATSTKLSHHPAITPGHHQESIRELTLKGILATDKAIALTVDHNNHLLYVHGDAQHILPSPHGEITQEITQIVVPSLRLPLTMALHRVKDEQQPVTYRGIKLATDSLIQQVNLQVSCCLSESADKVYIIKIVPEASLEKYFLTEEQEFESSRAAEQRIKELEQELKYTQENLQAIVEDLESKSEEQQAANEELQSTNEELRAINEEIHVISADYQAKIQELIELGHDLNNLLKSTEIGVIFLDSQLRIRKFTPAAHEVVALRSTDLERPLAELFWKIDCPQLLDLLHQVLATEESQALEVKLKQQEDYFLMRINLYQTDKLADKGLVITFVNINETKQAQQALKKREQSFQAIFNSIFQFIAVLDPAGIILEVNQAALDFAGLALEEVLNQPFWQIKWWTISPATQATLKQKIARAAQGEFIRYEVDILGADNRVSTIDFSIKPVLDETGKVVQLIPEGREISELKQAREQLEQTNLDLEHRVTERTKTLAIFSDRLKQIHRLAITKYQQIEDLLADYLQAGCQMFNLATGIVSKIDGSHYRIMAVASPLNLEVGHEFACEDTYCSEVINKMATVTFNHVGSMDSMKDHPVYLNLQLESFMGTPILVNGTLYGTLAWFACLSLILLSCNSIAARLRSLISSITTIKYSGCCPLS